LVRKVLRPLKTNNMGKSKQIFMEIRQEDSQALELEFESRIKNRRPKQSSTSTIILKNLFKNFNPKKI
jgi:hypothetical protein